MWLASVSWYGGARLGLKVQSKPRERYKEISAAVCRLGVLSVPETPLICPSVTWLFDLPTYRLTLKEEKGFRGEPEKFLKTMCMRRRVISLNSLPSKRTHVASWLWSYSPQLSQNWIGKLAGEF